MLQQMKSMKFDDGRMYELSVYSADTEFVHPTIVVHPRGDALTLSAPPPTRESLQRQRLMILVQLARRVSGRDDSDTFGRPTTLVIQLR